MGEPFAKNCGSDSDWPNVKISSEPGQIEVIDIVTNTL